MMGDAAGHATLGGNHVDIAVAVIVPDERDLVAVGRKARDRLETIGRGERKRGAAFDRDPPQVISVGEDDLFVGDVGKAVHRGSAVLRDRQGGGGGTDEE